MPVDKTSVCLWYPWHVLQGNMCLNWKGRSCPGLRPISKVLEMMSGELEGCGEIFKSIFEDFQEQKWLSLYVSYFCSQVVCWKISQNLILMLCDYAGGHEAFGRSYSHFPHPTCPANIFFCVWSFCSVLFHLSSFNVFPHCFHSLEICTRIFPPLQTVIISINEVPRGPDVSGSQQRMKFYKHQPFCWVCFSISLQSLAPHPGCGKGCGVCCI